MDVDKSKPKSAQHSLDKCIKDNEKRAYLELLWTGSTSLLIGCLLIATLLLPGVINKSEYGGLVFSLMFVVFGWVMLVIGLRERKRYKLIEASSLFLDPMRGVIGGQIGGRFDVTQPFLNKEFVITLSCKRDMVLEKGNENLKRKDSRVVWKDSMVGYPNQTARGMSVSFLFTCPGHLPDTGSDSIARITWVVSVEALLDVNDKELKFFRSWDIPVYQGSAQMVSSLEIPAYFLEKQKKEERIISSGPSSNPDYSGDNSILTAYLKDIQKFKDDTLKVDVANCSQLNLQDGYLEIKNIKKRPIGSSFFKIILSSLFVGLSLLSVQQLWWPVSGIIILIGCWSALRAIFTLGSEVTTKIDIQTRVLYMHRSWFGVGLYKRKVALLEPAQFFIKKTSTNTNFISYSIEIKNRYNYKDVLVFERINSREVATAVMNNIIEKAFQT